MTGRLIRTSTAPVKPSSIAQCPTHAVFWSVYCYMREREAANVESANRVLLYEREREAANVESANI